MQKEDILHLARLARIKLDDEEVQALKSDIESVLDYVGVINTLTSDIQQEKKIGTVYNVFREDVVINEGGTYTESILANAPKVKGRHLQVKKILQMD